MEKNKKIIIVICIVFFIGFCCLIGENNTNENVNQESNTQLEVRNQEAKQYEEIYKDDELINIFLNKYNELYADERITTEMLSVYYHHGSDHKDQVQFKIDGIEVTLTGGQFGSKVSVYMDKEEGLNDEKVRNLTKKFIKVFNSKILNEEIENHLNNQKSGSDIQTYDDIEYWTNKGQDNNLILYIKITGKIK